MKMIKKIAASVALALAAACGGGSGVGVSVRVAPATSDAAATASQGIQLERARVSLRRLRVESAARGEDHSLASGPILIDAAGGDLAGAVQKLLSADVPAGSYRKLKLDVHRPGAGDAIGVPGLADLAKQGASVILDGTIDGAKFSFASSLEAELEIETAFTVGDGASNLTLAIDTSKWFAAADGSRLDPRDASARLAIESNIRASLKAFEDDDEDGADDHGGHGGDDGPGDDHGGHGGDDGPGHH